MSRYPGDDAVLSEMPVLRWDGYIVLSTSDPRGLTDDGQHSRRMMAMYILLDAWDGISNPSIFSHHSSARQPDRSKKLNFIKIRTGLSFDGRILSVF